MTFSPTHACMSTLFVYGPLVNFTEARQIRRAFRNIRRTLPDLANVLILFLASLSLFSLMAVKLFQRRQLENGDYFIDYFDSFWQLYVLVTTANSPDVMMPAYDSNRGYVIFFVAFLLGTFLIWRHIKLRLPKVAKSFTFWRLIITKYPCKFFTSISIAVKKLNFWPL